MQKAKKSDFGNLESSEMTFVLSGKTPASPKTIVMVSYNSMTQTGSQSALVRWYGAGSYSKTVGPHPFLKLRYFKKTAKKPASVFVSSSKEVVRSLTTKIDRLTKTLKPMSFGAIFASQDLNISPDGWLETKVNQKRLLVALKTALRGQTGLIEFGEELRLYIDAYDGNDVCMLPTAINKSK